MRNVRMDAIVNKTHMKRKKREREIKIMITSKSRNNGRGLTWETIQPWDEPVDGAELLNELRGVFRRYVVLPKGAAEMLALWTVHTYAWQLREVTTYVGVSSPEKRCGKTTLLGVLSKVVHRPLAAANISPPALFRVIEEAEPSLLIDEADTFLQGNDEMRGILNAGYSRETAYVVRVGSESKNYELRIKKEEEEDGSAGTPRPTRLERFSCWCPKVMAAIGRLPDSLADRCIVIGMQRKTAQEECERLKNLDGSVLRRKCMRFVNDHEAEIRTARPELPKGLNDRAADIWEPLLVLGELAGDDWKNLSWEAARGLSGRMAESNVIGLLLLHIAVVFEERAPGRMFSRDLVAELNSYENRPWAEGRKEQRIDEIWLSQQLRPYGVRPKTLWIKGVIAKGYERADFGDSFQRYITRADLEEVKGKEEGNESSKFQVPSSKIGVS